VADLGMFDLLFNAVKTGNSAAAVVDSKGEHHGLPPAAANATPNTTAGATQQLRSRQPKLPGEHHPATI